MSAFAKNISGKHLLLIALMSIAAMIPAYYGGIPGGNDQPQHYQFAATVSNAIRTGTIYPGAASETNYGFGDYGLRFYPPLSYYILSIADLVIGDWYVASLTAFTLVFFIGALGIYLWARTEYEPSQALIAAMLYTFAPYHLNQIYNNFLLAEFFATAALPFCFLFLTRVCREGRWLDVIGLAVAYSALILTHLPLTILGSLTMAIYSLVVLRRSKFVLTISKLSIAVFAALAMTAFYWSRWITEMAWINHASPRYFSAQWDYRANFLMLPAHFSNFGEDVLNLWFADLMLAVIVLIAVPAMIYLIARKIPFSRSIAAVTTVLAVAIFMTTPLSSVVWDNVGFLRSIQFPWRWLAMISAFGAIFASIGIDRAADSLKNGANTLVTLGLGSVLAIFFFTAAFVTKGATYVSRTELNRQMNTVAQSEGCDCWWPVWAKRDAFAQAKPVNIPGREYDLSNWTSSDKSFTTAPGEPAIATVATFYYPHWQATINGKMADVSPDENGRISIQIPAGRSEVELRFREPSRVLYGNILSALAWLGVLVLSGILLVKSKQVRTTLPNQAQT